MRESKVVFPSGELKLEGLIALPDRDAAGAAVVCHPHPLYGGSMYNNVVEAILDALWRRGFATLRFNFRGVEGSEGEYDGGAGEADDARAAARFLAEKAGAKSVTLAGYSFGASMALRAGLMDPTVSNVIAVALPVGVMNIETGDSASKPVFLLSGDHDTYSPLEPLRSVAAQLGGGATLEIVPGADHFFGGYEPRLSEIVAAALGER
jgi:alpha/beta superfamily hydrolase